MPVPGDSFKRRVTTICDVPTRVCPHVQDHEFDPRDLDVLADLDGPGEPRNPLPIMRRTQNRAAGHFAQFHVPAHVIGMVMGVDDRFQADTERR